MCEFCRWYGKSWDKKNCLDRAEFRDHLKNCQQCRDNCDEMILILSKVFDDEKTA